MPLHEQPGLNGAATLAKVRALLAKAEDDAATPAEAKAYTAKAAELMARYGIDRAMLAAADPTTDVIGERGVTMAAPYARDKLGLLTAVALALRCKIVYSSHWIGETRRLIGVLFGFGSDLDRVEMLFTSLLVQAAHALAVEDVPPGESKAAYRRAWYAGYAAAVGGRLREAERRAAAEHQPDAATAGSAASAALVLAERSAQVERAYEDHFGHLRRAPRRRLSGGGSAAGFDAGQRADLGGTRLGRPVRGAVSCD